MYTSGACNSVPPSAIAMVAIAPGMFFAHSVVPSSGSTAISTCGPALSPTFSPMNSIGASSRSPSPITTVPSIGSLLSSRRIASTAAWSAAFSWPWPRSRAADTAARSVTRTISSVRMRSSNSCGGTEICVDILLTPQSPRDLAARTNNSRAHETLLRALVLLDPYHLRLSADDLVALHGVQRAAHGVFMRGIGDQDDRHWRRFRCARGVDALRVLLHDRFQGNLRLGEVGRDFGRSTGDVARHQANVVAALVALHRRFLGITQLVDRAAKRRRADAARHIGDIRDHGGCGCSPARAGADQRDRRNALAVDGHSVGHAHHLGNRGGLRHHRRMYALLDPLGGAHGHAEKLDAIAELFCGAKVFRLDRGNAFDVDRALRHLGAEGEAREDRKFLRGVVAVDVERRVGLGIAEPLRVLQAFGKRQSLLLHPAQDVVAGAVENAVDAVDIGSGKALAQRLDDRNASGHGRFVIQCAT